MEIRTIASSRGRAGLNLLPCTASLREKQVVCEFLLSERMAGPGGDFFRNLWSGEGLNVAELF
jgi:hypothetical protein